MRPIYRVLVLMMLVAATAVPAHGTERDADPLLENASVASASSDEHEMTSLFITSFDGTQIDLNVCRPAGASAEDPVPIVLNSHGWGGQKSSCLGRTNFFEAGIGFASMTQRGNGESTGENNVMDPDLEGRDIMAVIDHLASLDWVLKDDGPGGTDPVLGGLGGSYGGGFQWVGAFSDQYFRGAPTRFNSLRPGNTWYDLRTALAPNDVMRTLIVSGLYAGGVQNNDLAPWVHAAMATFLASGQVVDGPPPADFASEIHQHSAAWFVEQGEQLDIPVFIQQGAGDLVFNLNEGIDALEQAVTAEARSRSFLLNHQAGHGLPDKVPGAPADVPLPSGPLPYTARSGATCAAPSPLAWFRHTLLDEPLELGSRLRLRTVDGDCLTLDEFPVPSQTAVPALSQAVLPVGPRGEVRLEPVAQGPMTLAGAPTLAFDVTTTDPDARLFWGLAVGTSPDSAELIGGQWMPTRTAGPTLDEPVTTELGAMVIDLTDDQTLYLAVSPYADQFAAHPTRTAGAVVVDDVTLGLPIVLDEPDNTPPSAWFTYQPTGPRPGETVTFDASGSTDGDGDELTYNWQLGDGTTAEGPVVGHAYEATGGYEVTLTVGDGTDTTTTTRSIEVVANQPPTAVATSDPQRPRDGQDVTFDGTGSSDPDGDDLVHSWDLGDGTTASGATVTHTYGQPGRYTVTLTVSDGYGGSDSDTIDVIVRGGGTAREEAPNGATLAAETSAGGGFPGVATLALAMVVGLGYGVLRRRTR